MAHRRTILSVIGPHSGCGKTLLVIHLLRQVRGLGCLKISPAHDWPDQSPGVGDTTGRDYYLEDPVRLNHPGKDTALYLGTGAAVVNRLRHRADGLAAGLDEALHRYPPNIPIVVESSSAVRLLQPVAVVLVVRPPIQVMKPATQAVLSQVTDVLINATDRQGLATSEADRLRHDFPSLVPQFTWSTDLICQPPPDEMLIRLRGLLGQ